jgi:hypothetical protein
MPTSPTREIAPSIMVSPGCMWILRAALLMMSVITVARAEYTVAELLTKARTAESKLSRFSMQVWTRSYSWYEIGPPHTTSSVCKIIKGDRGFIAMVGVSRVTYQPTSTPKSFGGQVSRVGYRIEPGPRFLIGEWNDAKNKLIDRPVTMATYYKAVRQALSGTFEFRNPYNNALFGTSDSFTRPFTGDTETMRVAGRENIAGHDCIRLDGPSSTQWFDADTLLLRRILSQSATVNQKFGSFTDVFCDLRPLAPGEQADLNPDFDDTFEDQAMQWVPFIPMEQLKENLRITGRAAGLLIAAPEDQPQAQPALPPLTPGQRAGIVTIEGDVLSGLGFYTRYRNNDFLITDVRFVSENRWLKVRDWQGNPISFTGAFQAENARVALLKVSQVPGRLEWAGTTKPRKSALLLMLCAFDKSRSAMQPAFCVSRPSPAGSYEVAHALSDYISGGPIINIDDGTVEAVLIKSDPPKIKPPGPVKALWHAEPLFSHRKWLEIGLVPQR